MKAQKSLSIIYFKLGDYKAAAEAMDLMYELQENLIK
jgi:hypothetical protein